MEEFLKSLDSEDMLGTIEEIYIMCKVVDKNIKKIDLLDLIEDIKDLSWEFISCESL